MYGKVEVLQERHYIVHMAEIGIYVAVNFWFQLILKFNQLVFSNQVILFLTGY